MHFFVRIVFTGFSVHNVHRVHMCSLCSLFAWKPCVPARNVNRGFVGGEDAG